MRDRHPQRHVDPAIAIGELFFVSPFFPFGSASALQAGLFFSQPFAMKLSNQSEVPVYTISGSNTARPLPEWLARRRKRSLKNDPEYANRIELLQDFEFEEASQCVRVSEDGEWVMSTGRIIFQTNLSIL